MPLINQDNFRKTRRTADSTPRMFGPLPYRVNKKYSFLPTSGMRLPGRGPLRPTDDPPAGRVGAPPVLCCTGTYQVADYNEPGGDFNADLQGRPGIRSFGTAATRLSPVRTARVHGDNRKKRERRSAPQTRQVVSCAGVVALKFASATDAVANLAIAFRMREPMRRSARQSLIGWLFVQEER